MSDTEDKTVPTRQANDKPSPSVIHSGEEKDLITIDECNISRNRDTTNFNATELYANDSGSMFGKYSNNFRFTNFEKLKLSFDGHGCPKEFLLRLEELQPLKGYTYEQCLLALPLLLNGSALSWYRSRKQEFTSWSIFKILFLEQYTPHNHDLILEQKLRNRKQRAGESLSEFITEVVCMSSKLNKPLPESTLLELVKLNIHSDFATYLVGRTFLTLADLIRVGRDIETYIKPNKSYYRHPKVEAIRDTALTCLKCKRSGHSYRDCKKFPGIQCFKCGKTGTVTAKCTNCSPSSSPSSSTSKVAKETSKNS